MNYFKWTALGVGGVVAVAHIGVLGHLLGTTKDLAMRPQYPNINLPTGQYSSYNVDVNREGYSIRYNANDPKVLQRTTTLDLDKQHNNSGCLLRHPQEESKERPLYKNNTQWMVTQIFREEKLL